MSGVGVHQRPLVVVERPRLVDDLGGHLHLADVVQERGELCVPARARVEPEPVGDRDDEIDDGPAVAARVGVVRLDHVAEKYRRATVRARELERVVDAHLALAREDLEQRDEGQDEEDPPGAADGRDRDDEADRGERGVDEHGHTHRACVLAEAKRCRRPVTTRHWARSQS